MSAEDESTPSTGCVTEKSGPNITLSTMSTIQDGASDGLEHLPEMGSRSGGNAMVLACGTC